jgi:hypothetical protein
MVWSLVDKKFDVSELGLLIAPLMQIGPAFEGLYHVGGEVKDLSEAEMTELKTFVADELDLENDKMEAIIENAMEFNVGIRVCLLTCSTFQKGRRSRSTGPSIIIFERDKLRIPFKYSMHK